MHIYIFSFVCLNLWHIIDIKPKDVINVAKTFNLTNLHFIFQINSNRCLWLIFVPTNEKTDQTECIICYSPIRWIMILNKIKVSVRTLLVFHQVESQAAYLHEWNSRGCSFTCWPSFLFFSCWLVLNLGC